MILVDLREPAEFAAGHVPGALNIPFGQFPDRAAELPSKEKIVLICHSGRMGDVSASLLSERGYPDVSNLSGGMAAWKGSLQQ